MCGLLRAQRLLCGKKQLYWCRANGKQTLGNDRALFSISCLALASFPGIALQRSPSYGLAIKPVFQRESEEDRFTIALPSRGAAQKVLWSTLKTVFIVAIGIFVSIQPLTISYTEHSRASCTIENYTILLSGHTPAKQCFCQAFAPLPPEQMGSDIMAHELSVSLSRLRRVA